MTENNDKINQAVPQDNTPREILKAEIIGKDFHIELKTGHIPSLCYVLKLIEVEIDKMIIDNKIRQAQAAASNLIVPDNHKKHNIVDFLRRRR